MTRSIGVASWLVLLGLAFPAATSRSETLVATLHLDGLSFVSFGNEQLFSIPLGSSVQFEFGDPEADGSIPFTIDPSGVTILPIPMAGQYRELRYALVSPASGTLTQVAGGSRLDFTASVRATLVAENGELGSYTYTVPFTTEGLVVDNTAGDVQLSVSGMRMSSGNGHVQLVGAVTNREQAFPEPGTAVYTVLSGVFDRVP